MEKREVKGGGREREGGRVRSSSDINLLFTSPLPHRHLSSTTITGLV